MLRGVFIILHRFLVINQTDSYSSGIMVRCWCSLREFKHRANTLVPFFRFSKRSTLIDRNASKHPENTRVRSAGGSRIFHERVRATLIVPRKRAMRESRLRKLESVWHRWHRLHAKRFRAVRRVLRNTNYANEKGTRWKNARRE